MLEGLQNAAKISDLRRRLLFTFAILAIYRVGVAIPTPGIDGEALAAFFEQAASTVFGMVNLFSGGGARTVFHIRTGYYALHQCLNHFSAPHRGSS